MFQYQKDRLKVASLAIQEIARPMFQYQKDRLKDPAGPYGLRFGKMFQYQKDRLKAFVRFPNRLSFLCFNTKRTD